MKRADQHTMPAHKQFEENYSPEIINPEETGVDTPSEKKIPIPENDQPPSMGALPVDVMGSPKTEGEWQSVAGDESHEADPGFQEDLPIDNEIIATGVGPDPEHIPDNI